MQQTVVPHLGHFPFAIAVPLFVFVSFASFISTFCLHLTQYPVVIFPPFFDFAVYYLYIILFLAFKSSYWKIYCIFLYILQLLLMYMAQFLISEDCLKRTIYIPAPQSLI